MFKKQIIFIDWRGYMAGQAYQNQRVAVRAYVAGSFAIHRPVYGNEEPSLSPQGWSVTHVPTGQTVNSLFIARDEDSRRLTLADMKERVIRARRFSVAVALLDGLPWGGSASMLPPDDIERLKPLTHSGGYIRTGDESGLSQHATELAA